MQYTVVAQQLSFADNVYCMLSMVVRMCKYVHAVCAPSLAQLAIAMNLLQRPLCHEYRYQQDVVAQFNIPLRVWNCPHTSLAKTTELCNHPLH